MLRDQSIRSAVRPRLDIDRPQAALEVKSESGRASDDPTPTMDLKLSSVEYMTCMRAGRSARAHMTAESAETSPEAIPLAIRGRSAARLK